MAILFLELDDEITSAVGRLRGVSDPVVALVLPAGSRIASSRINFRLLAREAEQMGARLAIVSPEATARALAIAAGLPAYAAVREYQAATADGGEAGAEAGGAAPAGTDAEPPAPTAPPPVAPDAAPSGRISELPVERVPRRFAVPAFRGRSVLVAVLVLALLGGGGAAGVYFVLPEARVTVTPRVEAFGPLIFEVTADPDATANDPAAGIVAAEWLETTVEAQGTFRASGVKVTETKATGSVTFTWSGNQTSVSIPAGSVVLTKNGIAFQTRRGVVVRKAEPPPSNKPGTASVEVEAVKPGPDGNVAANTITVVPKGYNRTLLQVTNPQSTTGGTHVETKVVRQSDYDAAVGRLNEDLARSFDEWLDAQVQELGEAVVQRGSAVLDPAGVEPAAADIVGMEMDTFAVAARAAGRVVTFDPAILEDVGATRFRASEVPAGYTLLDDSVIVASREIGSDDPAMPRYEITASGRGYRELDAAALEAQILGKPVEEARTILGPYGGVAITLDPDWFGLVPSFDWRVTVEVRSPAQPS